LSQFESPIKRDRTKSESYDNTDFPYSKSAFSQIPKNSLTPVTETSRHFENIDTDMIPARISLTKTHSQNSRNSSITEKLSKRDSEQPSQDDISEESNDEDEDGDTFETKRKRKSSSIPPNMKIQRVHSLPHIVQKGASIQDLDTPKENEESKMNGLSISDLPESPLLINKLAAKVKKYDESFYYYFESLLSQKISIMMKVKNGPLIHNPARSRFLSIDNLMQ